MTDTTSTTNTPATPAGEISTSVAGDFSPDQLRQMAQWEIESGRLTREQADAMLRADGVPAAEQPEEGLSAEAAAIDRDFPPARPQDFEMPAYGAPGKGLTPEQSKFDALARGWLSDAKFTREIGSSLAREVEREAAAHARMTNVDRIIYGKSQRLIIERLWKEQTAEKISAARQLVRELDERRPGLLALLEKTGAGNNARLISALANQAERLAARRAK